MNNRHRSQSEIYRVQVLDRAFQILRVLAEMNLGASLIELTKQLDLHKSTTHRLVKSLESNRFLEQDKLSGKYHLGSCLLELALPALSRLDIYDVAKPHLRSLAAKTGETAELGVLRDGEVVLLLNAEGSYTIRTLRAIGTRAPAYCTSLGKSMLAFASPDYIESYLRTCKLKRLTHRTITTRSELISELRRIRSCGYAIDNGERVPDLHCVGAPIRDTSGEVIAAVSVVGPAFRMKMHRMREYSREVPRAAAEISKSLGYYLSPNSRQIL